MIKILVNMRLALSALAAVAIVVFTVSGSSVAQSPAPAPAKVEQLIDILSDPAVKNWLAQQVNAQSQTTIAAAPVPPPAPDATAMLSTGLTMIRTHVSDLIVAFPLLPGQFEKASVLLLLEFREKGLLGILALIGGVIVAGLGLEKLTRMGLSGYREHMKSLRTTNPSARLKGVGLRVLYALVMIAAFTIGSAGVFLVFDWPPLLREIVLGFLTVAIVTRFVLMLFRALLIPPFLGLANAEQYRVLQMGDARATHWYFYTALIVGWFTFVRIALNLLATFTFDLNGRLAIGIVAGFVQLLILLAAVWLRPSADSGTAYRIAPRTTSWLLTVLFVVLWLLRLIGSTTGFWLLLAVVALPSAIAAGKKAVRYVLREPDDGSQPFTQITLAVIDNGLRLFLIIAVTSVLMLAWGVDVVGMTQGDSVAQRVLRGGLNVAIVILAADFGWSVVKVMIARHLGGDSIVGKSAAQAVQQARLRTLLPIFQNILFAIIMVMAVLMILSSMGIQIAPLIAGAGVIGVAIGFGSQTLVKDVISGIFYLLDDAFRVGEWIESGSYKGTVEGFSLRSVKLRHSRGYLATVPFGELGAVQNMSRDWVIEKFSVRVGFDTDIDKVRKMVKKLGLELAADPEFASIVIEPLKMQGIQDFGDYGIELRMKMMTKPGEQFGMRRKALVRLRQLFNENGIEMPFPTVQVQGASSSAEALAAQKLVMERAAKAVKDAGGSEEA